jgi:hypothetical protein
MRLIRRISLFTLPILLLSAACDAPTATGDSGVMTGQLDGAAWEGDALVVLTGDTVRVFSSTPAADGISRNLAFVAVADQPGEYALLTAESRYDELLGGDVISYSAAVTGGTITFSSLGRGSLLASGTLNGVTIQGSRGTWTFTGGQFTGIVEVDH